MRINLRESLGRLDLETDNIYDLRNHYDSSKLSDFTKNRLAEALNKNAPASKINRILNENFAINVFPRNSEEYEKLEKVADYLTNYSPNNIYYRVEKTYFDFGQDWLWTTIIAYDKKGNSWQAIYPKVQEDILLSDSDEELEEIAKKFLRESRLDKGFSEAYEPEDDRTDEEKYQDWLDAGAVSNYDEEPPFESLKEDYDIYDVLNDYDEELVGNEVNGFVFKDQKSAARFTRHLDREAIDYYVEDTSEEDKKYYGKDYLYKVVAYDEDEDESLTEASYGGAYDIEDDMYFTKEELVEFADEFIEKFSDWSEHRCDLEDLYMDSPKHLVVDVYDQDDGVTHRAEIDIDMRKIRTPKSIYKYGDSLLKQWKDSYLEYHEYDESLTEEVEEEQLYKIVCKNGPSEWPFESALSYEDAEEIVDYYGGRWIDEKGFEWSMEIEEDDESTERANPFKESLRESIDISDYEELHYPLRDGDKYYQLYRKIENGKGVWAAAELDKYGSDVVGEPFKITYDQARGFEPIEDSSIRRLSRDLGKKLLPKRENLDEQINLPGYAVKYVTGYAGNGVNSSETECFRTEEERDKRVKELKDKNYIGIKTWKMDNFYHTLPKNESLTEGIEDLDSISSTKAKDMTDDDFKILKPLVDDYFKERKALGTWPDSVDERKFVKKWYKLADKCKEIAKNGSQGITGYGRLNDFIKLKVLELARSVDNTFLWYIRNQLEKFGELNESLNEAIEDEVDFYEDEYSTEVIEGAVFIEDGKEWAWVERVAGPIHLDFDNWAVWEAREFVSAGDFIIGTNEDGTNEIDIDAFEKAYYAAEKAYFVVDEDTGFIDWGPVENQTEAQDFLNSKVEDWEKDESLNESEELKEDYWYNLHYEDIGGGREYDYEVTYDELFDCLLELAFEEDDAPEDTKEYMDWVENNFDSLYSKYKDDILDYFEEDASQKEYDERDQNDRHDPYADRGVSPRDFY